ncbi:MAG: Asp23/Gls24 family envelope stress response protein [Kocuria sp.]|nr:Asp23/Gls24 family envelope stress response protein [Kocuria sp.]
MSTTDRTPWDAALADSSEHTAQPVEQRGTLSIPSAVVAKIAAQAAWEIDQVGAASGGILGIGARRDFERRPQAEAKIYGQSAVITLDVGVAYPAPLRNTAARIREHVIQRVEQLTGLRVDQIDLKISWLHRTDERSIRGALL